MIYLFINIILAIVPALLLLIYFYNKDKQKKEPVSLILKVFIFGFLSVIPALIIEIVFTQFLPGNSGIVSIFFNAFIVAALVEEWIKYKTVFLTAFNNTYFDEIADGIVYTITASLGFALFENIFYSTGPAATLILRGVTSVPLHATASGIMGYYIGRSKFENPNLKYKGLAIAVLIHGLYDFFLFYGSWMALLIFPLLIIAGIILSRLYKAALKEDRLTGRS